VTSETSKKVSYSLTKKLTQMMKWRVSSKSNVIFVLDAIQKRKWMKLFFVTFVMLLFTSLATKETYQIKCPRVIGSANDACIL
jgi:hypothetical protein